MGLRRLRSLRRAAVVAYAALLLVPLLLSGHHHDESLQSAVRSNCAVCVATLHSPAASAAPAAHIAPLAGRRAVEILGDGRLAHAAPRLHSVRGPPHPASPFSV